MILASVTAADVLVRAVLLAMPTLRTLALRFRLDADAKHYADDVVSRCQFGDYLVRRPFFYRLFSFFLPSCASRRAENFAFTEFYLVLPGFHRFYGVLSGFPWFYRVLPSFFRGLPGFTGFYKVSPILT